MEVHKRVVTCRVLIVCGGAVGMVCSANDRVCAIAPSQRIRRSVITGNVVAHVLGVLPPQMAPKVIALVIIVVPETIELIADRDGTAGSERSRRRKHASVPHNLAGKTRL